MDLTRFFFGCHAAVHASEVYDGMMAGIDRVLGDLSEDQMRIRPGNTMNSIGRMKVMIRGMPLVMQVIRASSPCPPASWSLMLASSMA